MKKIMANILVLILLLVSFVPAMGASTQNLTAVDWYVIQNELFPIMSRGIANNGRITITSDFESAENPKEPGGFGIMSTIPVDLYDFEVVFSFDKFTKVADQYLYLGFINSNKAAVVTIDSEHPTFGLMLRPTDEATTISCGEGILFHWNRDKKRVRVSATADHQPGREFEGDVKASWTNVKFAVKRNAADDGYDVFINGTRINNNNNWSFVDDIREATGNNWYFQLYYKDGDYQPATLTIKTINGKDPLPKSDSGLLQGSLLEAGEKYLAEGGPISDPNYVEPDFTPGGGDKPQSSVEPSSKPQSSQDSSPTSEPAVTEDVSGVDSDVTDSDDPDSSNDESGSIVSDSSPEFSDDLSDGNAKSSSTVESDTDKAEVEKNKGSNLWLILSIVVLALLIGGGVLFYLLRKQKQNK